MYLAMYLLMLKEDALSSVFWCLCWSLCEACAKACAKACVDPFLYQSLFSVLKPVSLFSVNFLCWSLCWSLCQLNTEMNHLSRKIEGRPGDKTERVPQNIFSRGSNHQAVPVPWGGSKESL